jgi:hypothetical protein
MADFTTPPLQGISTLDDAVSERPSRDRSFRRRPGVNPPRPKNENVESPDGDESKHELDELA